MSDPPAPGEATGKEDPRLGQVRLRWLKILRYRNVRPGAELRFDDTRNILLGRNGSGKTTLLKLLAAVISSDFSLLHDPYELEYQIEFNGLPLQVRAWTEESKLAPLTSDPEGPLATGRAQPQGLIRHFRATLRQASPETLVTVTVTPQGGELTIEGQAPQAFPNLWSGEGPALHRVATILRLAQKNERTSLATKQLGHAIYDVGSSLRRFDESLDTFRALVGTNGDEDVLPPPWVGCTREAGDTAGVWMPLYGAPARLWRDFCAQQAEPRADDLDVGRSAPALVAMVQQALGASGVEMRLRFQEKKTSGSTENWSYKHLRFQFTRRDGSIFSHELLSYGQKRLLSFLYYLALNDHVVIADELVNGLHHAWIELCLDHLGERQAFLTSQNPLLLDYLPPDSAERAERRYILCRVEPTGRGEELVWENMPTPDAQRFARAYGAGIQHASEVLLSKGLW